MNLDKVPYDLSDSRMIDLASAPQKRKRCVHMCVHVCACVCMCLHVCGCMCPSQKSNPYLWISWSGYSVCVRVHLHACV